jgi:penicillin-binding protein 1A
MKISPDSFQRFKPFLAEVIRRLRHPTLRGVALSLAALPVLLLVYVLVLIPFTPSITDISKAKSQQPARVLSVDGQELAVFQRANRDWVKLDAIAPSVLAALISTEDHRFYDHHGVDFTRTAAAVLHTASGSKQGGSTITQQLARNLYPEEVGRARSVTRKFKEVITAFKIESVYTKDEILESYLNTVPFLYNAYGIEMAARTYFDKSAIELDVLESATLIGMLKGTSYYNPVLNPERAVSRRNTVLSQMAKHQKLPAAQLALLQKKPLKIEFERQTETLGPAPHFTQFLRRWLIEWADRNDYNIYADGLVVRTTVDSRLQTLANNAVERQGDRLQKFANAEWSPRAWAARKDLTAAFVRETREYKAARDAGASESDALKQVQADSAVMQTLREDKTRLQAGFLALDPTNGHVMAWVGSRDFAEDQFDHVQQARRQPGSTFKPFVYGAALENGSRPNDTFYDQAVEIPLGGGEVWRPSDASAPSGQAMSLRDGLAYSKNTITAQVMQVVGPDKVAALAQRMGVRQSKLEAVPSLALGTSPVTLKEMVAAYATLANSGGYIEPILVTRVEDRNGKVLETFEDKLSEPAMPVATAQTLLDMMRGVIDKGTGAGIRSTYGIKADVAGKTGTTQGNTDGWFILMHPQLVAGAWVGFNDNRVTMGNGWGPGARSALPIVGEFFQQSLKTRVIDARKRFADPPDAGPGGQGGGGWANGMPPLSSEPLPENGRIPEVTAMPETDANPFPQVQPGVYQEQAPPQQVQQQQQSASVPQPLNQFPPLPPGVTVVPAPSGFPPAAADARGTPIPARELPTQGGIPITRELRPAPPPGMVQ